MFDVWCFAGFRRMLPLSGLGNEGLCIFISETYTPRGSQVFGDQVDFSMVDEFITVVIQALEADLGGALRDLHHLWIKLNTEKASPEHLAVQAGLITCCS